VSIFLKLKLINKPTSQHPVAFSALTPLVGHKKALKLLGQVVSARFILHAESRDLFLAYQSAYQHHHSTKAAVAVVHSDLVHNITNLFWRHQLYYHIYADDSQLYDNVPVSQDHTLL